MEIHDNVFLQANTAEYGGAVSLPFEIGSNLPFVVLRDTCVKGEFDSVAQLMIVSEAFMLIGGCWEKLMPMGTPDQKQNPRL